MRVAHERLIFLALCALDEIVDQAKDAPVPPSFALRFTLAFLFGLSDGKERDCYDGFWRNVTRGPGDDLRYMVDQGLRHSYAGHQLRGIARSLGYDFELRLRAPIDRARGKPPTEAERNAKAFRDAAAEQEKKKEWGRRARFCDLERVEPFRKGRR